MGELEAELSPEHRGERPYVCRSNLRHPAAAIADQVVMLVLGQMEQGGAVGEVNVIDDADLLEHGEVR